MTLTFREVHRARDLLWLVTGEEKVGALPDARHPPGRGRCSVHVKAGPRGSVRITGLPSSNPRLASPDGPARLPATPTASPISRPRQPTADTATRSITGRGSTHEELRNGRSCHAAVNPEHDCDHL